MQVYAVVYADSGEFLLGLKLAKGYFFYKPKTGGDIVPDGHGLNGGGKYALPGGKKEGGESIEDAARREFHEETAIDIGSVSGAEHRFTAQFGAGYFEVPAKQLPTMCTQIADTNLLEAQYAATDIEHGGITSYDQIHKRYNNCPLDNELVSVSVWDVDDDANWETIEGWQTDHDLDWFYEILAYLKHSVL